MLAQIRQRFDTENPDLCHCLRWKGQFIEAERDPTVPPSNDGLFWCSHTQKCIGPDGGLAEPGNCSSPGRQCHEGHHETQRLGESESPSPGLFRRGE